MRRQRFAAVLGIASIVAGALGVSFATAASGSVRQSPTAACQQVYLLGARGSGEPPAAQFAGMGPEVDKMAVVVQSVLKANGIEAFRALNVGYAADSVDDLIPTTYELALFASNPAAGALYYYVHNVQKYMGSISGGITNTVSEAEYVHTQCPHALLVLAGYSQGAMVMHQAELRLAADHATGVLGKIAGTLLLGDGDRVSGTAARLFGTSSARSQGVRTYLGQNNGKDAPERTTTANICNAGDIVCDFGLKTLEDASHGIKVHESYAVRGKDGTYTYDPALAEAATWVAELAAARLTPPVSFPGGGFNGITAVSATNAWAVGSTSTGILTAHWNGTVWKSIPTPSQSAGAELLTVSAASANDVWAGGINGGGKALILHWNGFTWKQLPIPNVDSAYGYISGVAASSSTNAWAAEWDENGTNNTVILHWNGSLWKRVPSPGPPGYDNVTSVAAISANNAWAAGYDNAGDGSTLIQHWNGTAWKVVPSPTPAQGGYLYGVAAVSANDAWAVGSTDANANTLILHWNGTTWKQVPAPAPAGGAILWGVAATSASSAWAVGQTTTDNPTALILHWNGTAWIRMSPAFPSSDLTSVTARSASIAWSVGGSILHWDGAAWN